MESKYNNRQLRKIYSDSINNKLTNKELHRIKDALYIICSNSILIESDLKELIEILIDLPDDKLKLIDNSFIELAKNIANINDKGWMHPINEIIYVLLGNYASSDCLFKEDSSSDAIMWFYDIDSSVIEKLSAYNEDFTNTLKASQEYLRNRLTYSTGELVLYKNANDIFQRVFMVFLSDIDYYDRDYSLPSKVINYVYENSRILYDILITLYNSNNMLLEDINVEERNSFAKILLDRVSGKDKVILINEYKVRQKIRMKNFYDFKGRSE